MKLPVTINLNVNETEAALLVGRDMLIVPVSAGEHEDLRTGLLGAMEDLRSYLAAAESLPPEAAELAEALRATIAKLDRAMTLIGRAALVGREPRKETMQ